MKYLIDGVNKSVLSLANQYKNLRIDDEYKVYDTTFSNIEGLDLYEINDYVLNENGEKIYNENDFDTYFNNYPDISFYLFSSLFLVLFL